MKPSMLRKDGVPACFGLRFDFDVIDDCSSNWRLLEGCFLLLVAGSLYQLRVEVVGALGFNDVGRLCLASAAALGV